MVKLRAAGVDVDAAGTLPLQPRLDGGEPAFDACYTAARDRRLLTFTYARPDEDTGVKRRVQPWGVVSWHGRWYLVGHDLDRDAPRVFRLSRISGTPRASGPPDAFTPPADLDLAAVVARQVGRPEHVVVLTARPGRRSASGAGPPPWARTTPGTTGWSCARPSRGRWPTRSPRTGPTCWWSPRRSCAPRCSSG